MSLARVPRSAVSPGAAVVLLSLALALAHVLATPRAPAHAAAGGAPTVTVDESGVFQAEGRFLVPAPVRTAWAVVTDYEHHASFIRSLRLSRVRHRGPGTLVVEQRAVGQFLFMSRTVSMVLQIREHALRRVEFRDVSGTDFHVYEGAWSLHETKSGTLIAYRLRVKPRFFAPPRLVAGAFRRSAQELFEDVRKEILRRL